MPIHARLHKLASGNLTGRQPDVARPTLSRSRSLARVTPRSITDSLTGLGGRHASHRMLGFGSFESASRFCGALDELGQYFRIRRRGDAHVSLAE